MKEKEKEVEEEEEDGGGNPNAMVYPCSPEIVGQRRTFCSNGQPLQGPKKEFYVS